MASIPLAQMVRRTKRTRRTEITFRPIIAPGTLASDLYAEAYAPVIAAWTGATEEITAAYRQALATLTQDSPEQVTARIGVAELTAGRILLEIRLRLERWALKVERWQRGKWRANVLSATGVDLGTMLGAADVRAPLGAVIERNVALVKSVSDQARDRISDAVFRGLTQRKPAAEVAKDIRAATGMARRRALNIAADQTVKITSALNDERRRQAGIDTWEWLHSGKAHPRPEHEARNGKRYSDDDPPSDLPGELPFCGCTSRACLTLDSEF